MFINAWLETGERARERSQPSESTFIKRRFSSRKRIPPGRTCRQDRLAPAVNAVRQGTPEPEQSRSPGQPAAAALAVVPGSRSTARTV